MDELGGGRELPHALRDGPEARRREEERHRTNPLSSGLREVASRVGGGFDASLDVPRDERLDVLHLARNEGTNVGDARGRPLVDTIRHGGFGERIERSREAHQRVPRGETNDADEAVESFK